MERVRDTSLVCCECGGEAQGNVSYSYAWRDDGGVDICDACHASQIHADTGVEHALNAALVIRPITHRIDDCLFALILSTHIQANLHDVGWTAANIAGVFNWNYRNAFGVQS